MGEKKIKKGRRNIRRPQGRKKTGYILIAPLIGPDTYIWPFIQNIWLAFYKNIWFSSTMM